MATQGKGTLERGDIYFFCRPKAEEENEFTADVFRDLKIDKSKRPTEPLLAGKWE